MKFAKFAAAAVAATLLSAGSAHAAYVYSTSVGVQPSNVGVITVTQVNATTVNVLVDLIDTSAPAPQYGFLNTGGPHTPFAFNLAGTESGVSGTFLQPSGGTFTFGLLSLSTTDGSNTPYGTYGISINSSAGNGSGNAYYGDLEFNVVRTSGLTIDDFITNAGGYYFSADLTNGSNTGAQAWNERSSSSTGSTGGSGNQVPEPGTPGPARPRPRRFGRCRAPPQRQVTRSCIERKGPGGKLSGPFLLCCRFIYHPNERGAFLEPAWLPDCSWSISFGSNT